MDVTLIYFSQTGNTRKVAHAMAEALREAGHSASPVPLLRAGPEDATATDLLGVGSPCFSSRAPTPVKEFLRSLPPLNGRRSYVFATSGGAPGRVLYDLTRLLRERGSEVLGGFVARGQVHHPAPHMTGRFAGRPGAEDLARARRFAVAVAEHTAAGRRGVLPESRPDALKRGWGLYDALGWMSADALLRFVLPEPRVDPIRCDACGWCIRECPMGNIAFQTFPVLGVRCIRCYRCLSGCPQEALVAEWRFADPWLRFFHQGAFMRRFGDVGNGERIS